MRNVLSKKLGRNGYEINDIYTHTHQINYVRNVAMNQEETFPVFMELNILYI